MLEGGRVSNFKNIKLRENAFSHLNVKVILREMKYVGPFDSSAFWNIKLVTDVILTGKCEQSQIWSKVLNNLELLET